MLENEILMHEGFDCLVKHLGLLEAERFISMINAKCFDYTEWRRTHLNFPETTVEEFSKAAMQAQERRRKRRAAAMHAQERVPHA